MPAFGKRSKAHLETCHIDLQKVLNSAILDGPDFAVICGHRGKEEQDQAVNQGFSKARFPNSKRNQKPSIAVDVVPYPVDWNDRDRFVALAKHILARAERTGVKLRWGGDWDGDGDWKDERFLDMPHFELVTNT